VGIRTVNQEIMQIFQTMLPATHLALWRLKGSY